jgi:hypothetical protein
MVLTLASTVSSPVPRCWVTASCIFRSHLAKEQEVLGTTPLKLVIQSGNGAAS